jgi:lysozyme
MRAAWLWWALGGAAALLIASRAQARTVNRYAPLIDGADIEGPSLEDAPEVMPEPYDPGPIYDPRDAQARAGNRAAFFDTIARFESSTDPIGYVMLYGGGTFDNFADHPANLGWGGVPLPDEDCAAAGFGPGCVSTAAGRYQITRTTWNGLRRRIGGELPDFSPASQDRAALELLDEKGALGLVDSGRFDEAIARVRGLWSSMPRAGDQARLDKWRNAYADAGGALA